MEKVTQEQKDLSIIYSYFCKLVREHTYLNFEHDEQGNTNNISDALYHFLIDYYGFNSFPRILTDKEYEDIEEKEVYHGFKDFEFGANLLTHFNYHYGHGYINGLYFADSEDIAFRYTRIEDTNRKDIDRVLAVKIVSPNCMTVKNLQEIVISPPSMLPDNTPKKIQYKVQELYKFLYELENRGIDSGAFRDYMLRLANFSVYLGIDYLYEEEYHHNIVHNRGIITTTEEEFDKFCSNSKHYTDGVFDFYNTSMAENYMSLHNYKKQNPEK